MELNEFKLERYFARYEFSVKHLLSPSDCESLSLKELLAGADRETLKLWESLKLGYTESQGHPLLREEIAALYPGLEAGDIIVAAPEEAILIAMHALLRRGDEVIAVDPAYQSLNEIPRSLGCRVIKWPVSAGEGKWTLDPDFLERNIGRRTRMVIINFPHNPTGYQPGQDEFERILAIAARSGAYLFADEMYRLLEHDPAHRLPPAACAYEKGISLFGLSKSFGLPGLRIGWLATGDKELLRRFTVLKDYTTICSSAPSEILALAALRNREEIVGRCREIVRRNLEAAAAFFHKYGRLFTWFAPGGGSIAFPRLVERLRVADFCREAVEKKNVMILPGDVFHYPGNHFRVGLGRADFPAACRALEEYIQEYMA